MSETTPGKTLHGTAVAMEGIGVLLLGPSDSGKSDLALRLVDRVGARLIADDRVVLTLDGGRLVLDPPAEGAGLIEVRGLGLVELPYAEGVPLGLAIQLVPTEPPGRGIDRLPEPEQWSCAGVGVPLLRLDPFEAAIIQKLVLAVRSRQSILGTQ